ncbi:hypothetical protein [Blautia sp. MSJ-19]|uniref:hypothetical protein n=1 Tax=Blautia sp. MSJ-19 TaxID=2841517 RepID=UPI001C0EC792|nr:hypothetical protein [Blautia sp. MSJ-19]MBU5480650.1 hypothetical protein [Blautia sp. MSJ-19]
MRKKNKWAMFLAVAIAMAVTGNSALAVKADEAVSEKAPSVKEEQNTEKEKSDDKEEHVPALCNEGNHELIENMMVLPTCTEKGYSVYKCKEDGCSYEEKRDETDALGHDLKEISMEEATADKPGSITYKCQREGCEYEEIVEIPIKDPNDESADKDKTDDSDTKENEKTDNDKAEDSETDPDRKPDSEDSDSSEAKSDVDEDLPDEDIDEEYATYASSTSTVITTEYDPETAVGTISIVKEDADGPTETEEVTGMTVPGGTTEIKKDDAGNITDLAVSTEIEEIRNGFSLTSENKKLHSISIMDKKDPKNCRITLSAKKMATELGMRLHMEEGRVVVTLTENGKTLYITKISDTEKELILTTSTGGTCTISKTFQKLSVNKDEKISGKDNQIILTDVNGNKPYLELAYAEEKAESDKKNPDEELYWIQPYGDEDQEPIVITIYKK